MKQHTQTFTLPLTKVTLVSDECKGCLRDTEVKIGTETLVVISGDDIAKFKEELIEICNKYRI